MVEKPNLAEISDEELGAMLRQAMSHIENLMHRASDKFKQSKADDWKEKVYEEALALISEARQTLEDNSYIAAELETRYGQSALHGESQFQGGGPWSFDQRWDRKDLTSRTVPRSRDIDEMLPEALENLLSLAPSSWWSHQQSLVLQRRVMLVI